MITFRMMLNVIATIYFSFATERSASGLMCIFISTFCSIIVQEVSGSLRKSYYKIHIDSKVVTYSSVSASSLLGCFLLTIYKSHLSIAEKGSERNKKVTYLIIRNR